MKDELLNHINELHTTELGEKRIKDNLKIYSNVIDYVKKILLNNESIVYKKGKNYYVELYGFKITINSYNYSVITAHLNKKYNCLESYLEKYHNKKIKIFIDMDGVIVDYILEDVRDYDKKRPLYRSIEKLEKISKLPNVTLYIFSATRYNEGYEQKNWWLDTYAPFFKKENRIIISREANNMEKSSILKAEYMKNYKRDGSILMVIDDDPRNLKEIMNQCDDVILLKDTVLED